MVAQGARRLDRWLAATRAELARWPNRLSLSALLASADLQGAIGAAARFEAGGLAIAGLAALLAVGLAFALAVGRDLVGGYGAHLIAFDALGHAAASVRQRNCAGGRGVVGAVHLGARVRGGGWTDARW